MTWRRRGVSIEQIVAELSVYLIGWRGYFGFCETPWQLLELDSWVRRRLRAVIWKQWKRHHARCRELTRRGVPRWVAQSVAASSRGPWPLSESHVVPQSLAQCLLPFAWPSIIGGSRRHLIYRTAVYGPVCPVVWEGGAVRLLPIPIDSSGVS
jgi:hypothetical protein